MRGGEGTRVIDPGGRFLSPGFIDKSAYGGRSRWAYAFGTLERAGVLLSGNRNSGSPCSAKVGREEGWF